MKNMLVTEDIWPTRDFYVYRNKRLIIHGSWFRLATPETLTKLARVKIDISNDMDAEWELDVKKSMARPPSVIRMRLKNIIEKSEINLQKRIELEGGASSIKV